jgi:peptidoglycan/xylan/chitin deacetylase (PgdA/CDA1 family)
VCSSDLAFDTNDMQFQNTQRFALGADFATYVCDAYDWLAQEGSMAPRMLSIGLHLRMIGRPGRIGALDRILRHITQSGTAWIATREQIARHWLAQHP